MYAIAAYLSDTAKRAMLRRTYSRSGQRRALCPLAVGMRAMGHACHMRPHPAEIASLLVPLQPDHYDQWYRVKNAARTFVLDWDANEVASLAAALGVA